jgi:alpha-D-xyloside xylohydrolase
VHGQFPYREMYFYGADQGHRAFKTQLAFDRLRYRMLPYTYSLAAAVTHQDAALMRPLAMDFREDAQARETGDQFLLGPSLLVCPVTRPGVASRPVYLPSRDRDDEGGASGGWYDFWTGRHRRGGDRFEADAPYESLPVFVKGGSILPMGPERQHTEDDPGGPITLWVYTGADASFELYEDDGWSYAYEKGEHARVRLAWDERKGTLAIGAREGSFRGLVAKRELRVVFVSPDRPVPQAAEPPVARTVAYDGGSVTVERP